MSKKILAVLLSASMLVGICACGGNSDAASDSNKDAVDDSSDEEETAGEDSDGTMLNFWGWGYEWGDYTDRFEEAYPEENIHFNQVNLDWDVYQTTLDLTLQEGSSNEQYADVFGMEVAFVKKYVESDYTMDLAELWGSEEALMAAIEEAGISSSLVEIARSSDGKLKGLCFQQTGCVLAYRRSLAKEYLGTDDPDEIYSKYACDPETFIETCKMVHEKSGGAVLGVSSLDDITIGYNQYLTEEPIKDDVIDISDAVLTAITEMHDLYESGATNDTGCESEAYYADIQGTSGTPTLFTQGAPWHMKLRLFQNMGDTDGDWGICASPFKYTQGGTWLAVGKDTLHPEECKRFLEFWALDTTEKGLGQMCIDNSDCAAAAATVARVTESGAANEHYGGQDILTTITEASANIPSDAPCVKYVGNELTTCQGAWYAATRAWNNGEVSDLTGAVEYYITSVQATYPDAVAEDGWEDIVAEFEASL